MPLSHFRVAQASPLLEFLFANLTKLKKTKVKQILKFGSVRVNGLIETSHRHGLHPGDTVEILSKDAAHEVGLRSRLDFAVLYEDNEVFVVDKPAGLLTIGTDKEHFDTLYYQLTEYARAKKKFGHGRVFIVHRLDRESSGLVVFAKTMKSKEFLQKNWKRAVKKYYAVVEGTPKEKQKTLKSHLAEDSFRRVYSVPKATHETKEAITRYSVLKETGRYTLLEVTLDTGRKNQIRVQLAEIGHPLVGDAKYGSTADPMKRLGLHAYFLSFPQPETGKILSFESPMPKGFKTLLDKKDPA